ncbi:MAG: Hint domain-containing protein [Negativicutes bacterium]|nr:Hint domain-containing protein [Negativicutes bacterium]
MKIGDKLLGQNGEYNTVENFENLQPEGNFYCVNGILLLYENQSIIANGQVIHVSEIKVGDVLTTVDSHQSSSIIGHQVVETIDVVQGEYYFYRLTISGDHTYYLNDILVHNASRYWVGGGSSTNWNATGDTNWSGTSGDKLNKASVPTSSDDVIFDQDYTAFGQGGTCNLSAETLCGGFNMTGASNLTFSGTGNFKPFGDITVPSSGITWTQNGYINIYGTSNVNIGMALPDITGLIINNGATVTLTGNLNIGTIPLYVYQGILNTNGYQLDCGIFGDSGYTNTRGITFGTSTINCTSFSWTGTSGTATFTVNTEYHLNVSGGEFRLPVTNSWSSDAGHISVAIGGGSIKYFEGRNATFHDVTLNMGSGSNTGELRIGDGASYHPTFNHLTLSSTGSSKSNSLILYTTSITVTESLAFSGVDGAARMLVWSYPVGTAHTITYNGASAPTAQYVDFWDITAAGTYDSGLGRKWDFRSSTSVGELPGNSEIYCTTADDLYWKKDTTGSWSSANWDTVEGSGAGDGRVPLPQDSAYFTNNTFTNNNSYTVTQDLPRIGSFDWSGMTRTGKTFAMSTAASLYGTTYKLAAASTISGTSAYIFAGRNTQMITSNGKMIGDRQVAVDSIGGTVRIADNLSIGNSATNRNSLTVTNGTFDATNNGVGNYSVTLSALMSANDTGTIIMGSGIWEFNGAPNFFNIVGKSQAKLSAASSNIVINNSRGIGQTFDGRSLSFNNITYQGSVGSSIFLTIVSSNTFNTFTISDAPKTVKFTDGTTTTLNGTPVWNGSAGNIITLTGTGTGGWNLVKLSGKVTCNYCNVSYSNASGGADFNAYTTNGNVDGGSNTGWNFNNIPAANEVLKATGTVKMQGNISF